MNKSRNHEPSNYGAQKTAKSAAKGMGRRRTGNCRPATTDLGADLKTKRPLWPSSLFM